jgi:GT2 family glycosyltransferase
VTSHGARYLHLDRRGLSRARNAALQLATTPWLYFPDDDCTVASDVLAQIAEVLTRAPGASFVAARGLTPAGVPIMAGMDERERPLRSPSESLATVMSAGLFASRALFDRCGFFDERFGVGAEWPSGEESDLLFRAFASGLTGVYAPHAHVVHPDPFTVLDPAGQLRRARLYGRGWGALFAKHASGPAGARFAAMQRRYEWRALAGALLATATFQIARARRQWETWRGRREGWRGWRDTASAMTGTAAS